MGRPGHGAVVRLVLALAVGLPAAGAEASDLLAPENRTVSSSKQFIVHGLNRDVRLAVSRRAEQLKEEVLREWSVPDQWKAPVVVVIGDSDALRMRRAPLTLQVFDAGDAGRKVQLDVAGLQLPDGAELDRALLRAILLEMSLRRQRMADGVYAHPPEWLVCALGELFRSRAEGVDASAYASLVRRGQVPRLERFLRENPAGLRGTAAQIHAAQCLGLYEALAALPQGKRRLAESLAVAEPPADPVERFRRAWPELADEARAARLWALALARLSAARRMEPRSAEDTAERLAAVLQVQPADEATAGGVESWIALSRTKEGRFALGRAAADLQRLGFRAHPLYAPLVEEYRALFEDLSRGRRRGVERKATECEELRVALDARSREIADYLNWYQATQEPATPRREAAEFLAVPREPAALRRGDAISRYLDSVQDRGW